MEKLAKFKICSRKEKYKNGKIYSIYVKLLGTNIENVYNK